MKRKKRGHRYANKIETPRRVKLTSSISILFTGILLSLLFAGCGTVINKFTSEGEYEAPQLPKSELATIKIDTEGGWLQRYKLIAFRIDGKLAVRKQIDAHDEIAINEILVLPGKRDMSVTTIHRHFFDNDTGTTSQIWSKFSADIKAGGTYLLKDDNKLVDANTGEVVSQWKLF
ncbi:hypothetical protein C6500_09995 [Candidatus Poribacteria bacterium]|nr:MAG: hypothetical protein C6500_09995 [Candidatus Poribacteria bacterium]